MQPAMPSEDLPDAAMARDQVAFWLGFALPEECVEGVALNLRLLAEHGKLVRSSLDELVQEHVDFDR